MGKSIIFEDADFSQNGFAFGNITKKYNQLKDLHGNDVSVINVKDIAGADSAYLVGNNGYVASAYAGNACTDYVDVEGFETFEWKGKTADALQGVPMGIVCFYDSSKTLVGSYTLNKKDMSVVEGGNIKKVYSDGLPLTTISGNIPTNAKFAKCHCYKGATEFSFTISKVVVE